MRASALRGLRRHVRLMAAGLLLVPAMIGSAMPGSDAATPIGTHAATHASWHLDPRFGTGGIVSTDFAYGGYPVSQAFTTAIQPDGKILAAGNTEDYDTLLDVASVARYLPDGALDASFGDGGRVMLGPHPLYIAGAMALQHINNQDKIVLGVRTTSGDPHRYRCSIVRLNPDGSLDTDHDGDPTVMFGTEGIKTIRFPANSGFCNDLTVAADGRIVGIVSTQQHGGDVGVFRLRAADGQLDPTFGGDGKMTVVRRGYQVPNTVALQPQPHEPDRILVGGLVSRQHGYDWALWRITADGRVDPTFGANGMVVTTMRDPEVQQSFDSVTSLVVTPHRSIVAVGDYRAWPDGAAYPEDTPAAVRYLPDGARDASFGDGGRVHLPYDGRAYSDANEVTLDGSGRIQFAANWSAPTYGLFLVGGLMPDGRPDTRFGKAGFFTYAVGGGRDAATSLARDQRGRLVVVGVASEPGSGVHDAFGITRLTTTP